MEEGRDLTWIVHAIGTPISSAEDETYSLFAQELPSRNLGFVDSRAQTLELTVAGQDLTITQSPSILSSNRSGGTTGAVVWQITPLFAEWASSPSNILFRLGALSSDATVVELGCGISAIAGLLLGPRVARYVLTDQPYVSRLVEQNLSQNSHLVSPRAAPSQAAARRAKKKPTGQQQRQQQQQQQQQPQQSSSRPHRRGEEQSAAVNAHVFFSALDWETDAVTPALTGTPEASSFDVVLACDCIYNEALIHPFVQTCADLCKLRREEMNHDDHDNSHDGIRAGAVAATAAAGDEGAGGSATPRRPCVCVVPQQLRDPEVFEGWLTQFNRAFHVWRVPDEQLSPSLRSDSGFVVHVGVLR